MSGITGLDKTNLTVKINLTKHLDARQSKYRNNIMKKHIKGLLKFMDVYSIDNGLVVTKDLEHEELVDGKHIGYVPLWKWLLGSS